MQIKTGHIIRGLRRRDSRKQEDPANAPGVTCQAVSRREDFLKMISNLSVFSKQSYSSS